MAKEIFVNNKTYPSINAACRDLGYKSSTISQRIRYGYTIEEAFSLDFNKYDKRKQYCNRTAGNKVEYKGREYKSIKVFCKENNCLDKYSTIIAKLNKGYSLEEIMDKHSSIEAAKPIVINYKDKKYNSLMELCRVLNLEKQYAHVRYLYKKGDDINAIIEEAINLSNRTYQVNGKIYYRFKDLAEDYNVHPALLRSQIKYHPQDSIEEILERRKQGSMRKKIIAEGMLEDYQRIINYKSKYGCTLKEAIVKIKQLNEAKNK